MTCNNDDTLQVLCRKYLHKLRLVGARRGIDVDSMIRANKEGICKATVEEVELLSRCVCDERVSRVDIPRLLGLSYRQCVNTSLFDKIKKLPHVGVYSKISVLINKNLLIKYCKNNEKDKHL